MKMSKDKIKIAKYLAKGRTYNEAASKFGLAKKTIQGWMSYCDPATDIRTFRAYVDELTLSNELNTKAGILRRVNRAINVKEDYLADDKSTMIDWIKQLTQILNESEDKEDATVNITINKAETVEIED